MESHRIIRSPLFYVGDKYKLLKEILPLFPEKIENFYEPFVGGGSVFLNVDAKKYFLNDLNSDLIQLQVSLQKNSKSTISLVSRYEKIAKKYGLSLSYLSNDVSDELKKKYPKTYFSHFNKIAYNKLRDYYNASKKRSPDLLYLLIIYGFNRMIRFNSKGYFNLPVGNVDFNANVVKALSEYERIIKTKDIVWSSLDFEDFIKDITFNKDDFIYIDPPYLITSSEYNKIWTEKEETRLLSLLDRLDKRGVKFAISNVITYKNKTNHIFESWSKNYIVSEISSNYISFNDNTKKNFREVLVVNYEKARV